LRRAVAAAAGIDVEHDLRIDPALTPITSASEEMIIAAAASRLLPSFAT